MISSLHNSNSNYIRLDPLPKKGCLCRMASGSSTLCFVCLPFAFCYIRLHYVPLNRLTNGSRKVPVQNDSGLCLTYIMFHLLYHQRSRRNDIGVCSGWHRLLLYLQSVSFNIHLNLFPFVYITYFVRFHQLEQLKQNGACAECRQHTVTSKIPGTLQSPSSRSTRVTQYAGFHTSSMIYCLSNMSEWKLDRVIRYNYGLAASTGESRIMACRQAWEFPVERMTHLRSSQRYDVTPAYHSP